MLTLRLPMPLARQGSADAHWAFRYRNKKKYALTCDTLLVAKQVPPPPAKPYAKVRMSVVARVYNPNDDDNLMARCKWALDWLKTRGYIVDDRRKCVQWSDIPEQIIDRSGPATLTITLEPIEET
jgi:hypothetical protein